MLGIVHKKNEFADGDQVFCTGGLFAPNMRKHQGDLKNQKKTGRREQEGR